MDAPRCPFRNETEASLRLRFEQLLWSLDKAPLVVPATNQLSADIVTMSDLLLDIKESVYCSVQKFPHRADILSDLWRNNGSLIAAQKQAGLLALGAHDYYRYRCGPDDAFSFNCHKPDS